MIKIAYFMDFVGKMIDQIRNSWNCALLTQQCHYFLRLLLFHIKNNTACTINLDCSPNRCVLECNNTSFYPSMGILMLFDILLNFSMPGYCSAFFVDYPFFFNEFFGVETLNSKSLGTVFRIKREKTVFLSLRLHTIKNARLLVYRNENIRHH